MIFKLYFCKKVCGMSIGITVATVMFCFYLYQYIEEKRNAKEEERKQSLEKPVINDIKENRDMNVGKCLDERTISGLVLTTLRNMGCEPETELSDDTNWIVFLYQGEQFTIECRDDCYFITIFDTWWYQISTYSDIDEIANLHKTVNWANRYANCTLFYTTNEETEQIGVHSKKSLLFIKEIPDLEKYLTGTMNDMFRVQRFVLTELEKCKVKC